MRAYAHICTDMRCIENHHHDHFSAKRIVQREAHRLRIILTKDMETSEVESMRFNAQKCTDVAVAKPHPKV